MRRSSCTCCGKSYDSDADKPSVYIGQAGDRKNGEGILPRLLEHNRNFDARYWSEAVVLTTSNNSFGRTEISFLENKFHDRVVEAGRYDVRNSNSPSPGHITEEKESELNEFAELAEIVIKTLGYRIFEPLTEIAVQDVEPLTNIDPFDMIDVMSSLGITVTVTMHPVLKNIITEWRIDNKNYYRGNIVTKDVAKAVFYKRYNDSITNSTDRPPLENNPVNATAIYEMLKGRIQLKKLPQDVLDFVAKYGLTIKTRTKGKGSHAGLAEWCIDGSHSYNGKPVGKPEAAEVFLARYKQSACRSDVAEQSGEASVDDETTPVNDSVSDEDEAMAIAEIVANTPISDIADDILAKVRRYGLTTADNEGVVGWYVDGKAVMSENAADIFLDRYDAAKVADDKTPPDIDIRKESVKFPLSLYLKHKLRGTNFIVDAVCTMVSENLFVVLRGSIIYPHTSNNLRNETVRKARKKSKRDSNNKLLKEEAFKSSTAAAEYVIGNNCNGLDHWKTADGISLKDIFND